MISLIGMDPQVQYNGPSSSEIKAPTVLAKGEFDLSRFPLCRRDGSKTNDLEMGEMEYREALKLKLST
jgi:hypothetical protein